MVNVIKTKIAKYASTYNNTYYLVYIKFLEIVSVLIFSTSNVKLVRHIPCSTSVA